MDSTLLTIILLDIAWDGISKKSIY